MNEKNSIKKGNYILLGLLLIVLYQGLLPELYFLPFMDILKENSLLANFIYIGYYVIILILLILLFRKSLKKEWNDFKKNKKEYIKIAFSYWIKGLIIMILSNLLIVTLVNGIAGNEEQNREIIQAYPIYAITLMCIIGPFIEELIFRKSFKKAFKSRIAFATFTSLIFASLHVLNGIDISTLESLLSNWQQLLFLLPYGSLAFFFALAYYDTDNIFTSTLTHTIHNTFSVIMILILMALGG